MKKDITVLTLDSGKGIKLAVILLVLFLPLIGEVLQDYKINDIFFVSNNGFPIKDFNKYKNLIDFKKGDNFSYKDVKKSMENLFKMDFFSNIEVKIEKLGENRLNVRFVLTKKYTIHSIGVVRDISIKKVQ